MTARNALMELIEQGRRLSKHNDMMVLSKIDFIFKYLWLIETKQLKQYRDILEPKLAYYHKPPLFDIIRTQKTLDDYFKSTHDGVSINDYARHIVSKNPKECAVRDEFLSCKLCDHLRKAITDIFDGCLNRYKKDKESMEVLICEIVDFMHERPELVNISLIDEYMASLISEVCVKKNKINPLETDLVERFGKFWKDRRGVWHEEKRKRF